MLIDLNPLPYRLAFEIIEFCATHDIDKDKCLELIEACHTVPVPNVEWTLNVPEKYINWIVLKYHE